MDTENDNALALRPVSELAPAPEQAPADPYLGASTLALTPDERKTLIEPLRDDEIKEFPANAGQRAGLLYMDHVAIRRRLNKAVGPGAWALIPGGDPIREANYVCQRWRLYIRGSFVAEGFGEQAFRLGTNTLTFPTALEGAKSDALSRCVKDLGMGIELWDKAFVSKWKLRQDAARRTIPASPAPTPPESGSPASEPPAAKEPAREPGADDDTYEITGTVASVALTREGKRKVKVENEDGTVSLKELPWKLWEVVVGSGEHLSTFSSTIEQGCQHLMASGRIGTFTVRDKPSKDGQSVYVEILSMKGAFAP